MTNSEMSAFLASDHDIAYVGVVISDGTKPHMGDLVMVINPLDPLYKRAGYVQCAMRHLDGRVGLQVLFGDERYVCNPDCLIDSGTRSLKKHFPHSWEEIVYAQG